jgi:hypothetical protein
MGYTPDGRPRGDRPGTATLPSLDVARPAGDPGPRGPPSDWDASWDGKLSPLETLRQAQLEVFRHPRRIMGWAQRSIDVAEAPLPKPLARQAKPEGHARTAQWAAFVLSGAGR